MPATEIKVFGAPMTKDEAKLWALAIASYCVRNTYLEDLHAGTAPPSKIGDNSDVKVVGPAGEVPWNEVSRFNNDEMQKLMKEFVDNIYTVLLRMDDPEFVERFLPYNLRMTAEWDEPNEVKAFSKP